MLGKSEGRRRRGRQDEMVGWHHRLDGLEFKQAMGVDDGQGSCRAALHEVANSRAALHGVANSQTRLSN